VLGSDVQLFGSFANTFTIANSDIDCCVTDPTASSNDLQQSGLPEQLDKELSSRGFHTTLLSHTRIPILKVFRPANFLSKGKTYNYPLSCDVGWQNRLALHNTRLLATYSKLDPRVRQMALFVKYWTKTRGIARPRYGTLCSYGYVLMIIFFLVHVVSPAVLPNLQTRQPRKGEVRRLDEVECEGCDIYFSDGEGWMSHNTEVPPSQHVANISR
jgi:DNA polymerase sigma